MKQADYTISDVLRLRPDWLLNKQTDKEVYGKHLQAMGRMIDFGFGYIADYLFYSVFGDYDISKLSVGELNKRIVEYTKPEPLSIIKRPTRQLSPLFTDHKKLIAISTRDERIWTNQIRAAERELETCENEIKSYHQAIEDSILRIQEYSRKVAEQSVTVEALRESFEKNKGKLDLSTVRMLKSLPAHWLVVDYNVTEKYVTLFRSTPVTIRWTNANTGMNKTLYMGFYALQIYLDNTFSLRMARVVADGQTSRHPCHPHVSSYVCFGNMQHQASKAAEAKNLSKYLTLVDSILETYNEGNPFVTLTTFTKTKNTHYAPLYSDREKMSRWFMSDQFTSFIHNYGSDKFREETTSRKPVSTRQNRFNSRVNEEVISTYDKFRDGVDGWTVRANIPDRYSLISKQSLKAQVCRYKTVGELIFNPSIYRNVSWNRFATQRWKYLIPTMMYLNNVSEIRVHDGVFKLIDGNPQHCDYFINEYGDRVYMFLPDNSRLVFIQDGTDGAEYPLMTGPEVKLADVDEDIKEEAADALPF